MRPSGVIINCNLKLVNMSFVIYLKKSGNKKNLLIVCNHPARFGRHKYCGIGDKIFLIYHVILRDHVFKGLCDLMG